MSISEDTRCWLLLPAPRPLSEAPAAMRRYVTSSRTILRRMAALILTGTALMTALTWTDEAPPSAADPQAHAAIHGSALQRSQPPDSTFTIGLSGPPRAVTLIPGERPAL